MTSLRLSHILYRVDDLPTAVRDYEKLGFTVEWGSDPDSAHNALIRFPCGPFLELLTVPAPDPVDPQAPGVTGRLARWAAGHGWIDLAVETDEPHLGEVHAEVRSRGIECTDPLRYRRSRADGVELSWWIFAPVDPTLPFVMSAYSPPQPPPSDGGSHPNGATGIARVVIGAVDPDRARARWECLLGAPDSMLDFVRADHDRIVDVRLAGVSAR